MFIEHFIHILFEILPVFFIAVICSSLLEVYLPDGYFEKAGITVLTGANSSRKFSETLKYQLNLFWMILASAFLGALIPICTCGMIPLALGLYRKQLDWKIILAFLLAGNACSVPALILNYGIFGLEITAYRLLMAVAFAVLVTYVFILSGEAKIAEFIALKLAPDGASKEHCCEADHGNHAAVHEHSSEDHHEDDENVVDVHQHKLGANEVSFPSTTGPVCLC